MNGIRRLMWKEVMTRVSGFRTFSAHYTGAIGMKVKVYGIPRGGAIVAGLLRAMHGHQEIEIVSDQRDAQIIVDDIFDTGETRAKYVPLGKAFWFLVHKADEQIPPTTWVVFPWEKDEEMFRLQGTDA